MNQFANEFLMMINVERLKHVICYEFILWLKLVMISHNDVPGYLVNIIILEQLK